MQTSADHDQRTPALDPGPVPAVVEPETAGRVTTIAVSPRMTVLVIEDVGRTGMTGLTIATAYGESVTAPLPATAVDALVEALTGAAPAPYLPAEVVTRGTQ